MLSGFEKLEVVTFAVSRNDAPMNKNSFPFIAAVCALLTVACAKHAEAGEETLPLWELGVGAGGFSLPQYMGSDERYTIPFAFPYVIYRGEHWRVDRDGLRNRLFDSEKFSLEVSLSGGLPVKNSNQARAGMPELHFTGEIGPKINWYISEKEHDSWVLKLPLRAAVNVQGDYLGWVTDPKLTYSYHTLTPEGSLHAGFDIGVHYSSQLYHQTYYGVEPLYATADRPAYQAREGLHSVFMKGRLRYSFNNKVALFAGLQFRSLQGGIVHDSPLVKNNLYSTLGVGVIWLFSASDEVVVRGD